MASRRNRVSWAQALRVGSHTAPLGSGIYRSLHLRGNLRRYRAHAKTPQSARARLVREDNMTLMSGFWSSRRPCSGHSAPLWLPDSTHELPRPIEDRPRGLEDPGPRRLEDLL